MFSPSIVPSSPNVKQPEVIWLDPFEPLAEISTDSDRFPKPSNISQTISQTQQWKQYLNLLALAGFEQWLHSRRRSHWMDKTQCINRPEAIYNLCLNGFAFNLITKEHILDEVIGIPEATILQPELSAHFYVLIEVLEENQAAIIRGFLRHEALLDKLRQTQLYQQDSLCYIPLSTFDTESDRLIFYCDFLPLEKLEEKIKSLAPSVETAAHNSAQTAPEKPLIRIGQWLDGIFPSGWESIESLMSLLPGPKPYLAAGLRTADSSLERTQAKRGKLLDMGLDLEGQRVVLLVNVTQAEDKKLSVLVQLHPSGEAQYLPAGIALTLLSDAGQTLQEVQARAQDNYIQLKSFKGLSSVLFRIAISLGEVRLHEAFEL